MRKRKQVVSLLVASAMAVSLVACGGGDTTTSETSSDAVEEAAEESSEETADAEASDGEEAADAAAVEGASVDFEDGNFAFVKVRSDGDKSNLSVTDFNGSKALYAENVDGSNMFIGINVSALLGDKVADLATINMDLGTASKGGEFNASSGVLYAYTGADNEQVKVGPWSVYVETANPKTATFDVSGAGFVAGADNYIVISKETDNGDVPGDMYIDNIQLLDASGSLLTADTAAEFGDPANFGSSGVDRANLFGLTHEVVFEGFATKADGWAQDGFDMPQEIIDALVPGSVVEINYKSDTGHMWLVMPDSEAGWMRVGVGDWDGSGQQYAYTNNAGTTAQVTYEQLAAVLGDDVSTWGARMQCESDGAWEVTSVKVGTASTNYVIKKGAVDSGYAGKADGWAQDGFDMSEDFIAALVPGSVVEISYKADTGHIWLVMPDATAGWMRVGVGDYDGSGQGYITMDGSKAYVPYETLAEILGDDVSSWGARMQCESDGAWEVTSVRVGEAGEIIPNNSQVVVDGFAFKADGWAQDGMELTEEQLAALVPGSVINISYKSESGEIWLVFPDAAAGWMRVGVGDYDGSGQGYALCTGNSAQIPFETIAEILGDDVSTWGTRIQGEASTAWEITGLSIGSVK